MQKPEYELAPLRAAVVQEHMNITAFQLGIDKAREKIKELEGYIGKWEEYNGDTGRPDS